MVNVDNDTLRLILNNPEAMAALKRIEGWRVLGENIIEAIINKYNKVKNIRKRLKTHRERKEGIDRARKEISVAMKAYTGQIDKVCDTNPGIYVPY